MTTVLSFVSDSARIGPQRNGHAIASRKQMRANGMKTCPQPTATADVSKAWPPTVAARPPGAGRIDERTSIGVRKSRRAPRPEVAGDPITYAFGVVIPRCFIYFPPRSA